MLLVKGLEDFEITERLEFVQTTALLRSARILRRVLETCCHSNSGEKPSANAGVKNSNNKSTWNLPENKENRRTLTWLWYQLYMEWMERSTRAYKVGGDRRVENRTNNYEHSNFNIVKTSSNTDKGPEDLWRCTVTESLMKTYQLTLYEKKNARGEGGIVQEIEIWLNEQMVYAQPRICPKEWEAQTPLRFWDTNGWPHLGQMTWPWSTKKKKKKKKEENLQNCGLCCPSWPQCKIESQQNKE